MVTFKGQPNMLVTLTRPVGGIKRFRFDENGEYTTDNEQMIERLHHRFDSLPAIGSKTTPELDDDFEPSAMQEPGKLYRCNQCDFKSANKGMLLTHKKSEHPIRAPKGGLT